MRYAQGDGLIAEGRRRREQVRLEAVKGFEQRVPTAVIAVGPGLIEGCLAGTGADLGPDRTPSGHDE
jgi:hypothetical protein